MIQCFKNSQMIVHSTAHQKCSCNYMHPPYDSVEKTKISYGMDNVPTYVVVNVEFETSLLHCLLDPFTVTGISGWLSTPLAVIQETADLVVSTSTFLLRTEPIHPSRGFTGTLGNRKGTPCYIHETVANLIWISRILMSPWL